MRLPEVYEVATFYHHFDVIKEGDTPPPKLTVRVCDSLSCELAGALPLLEKLRATLGAGRARDAGAVRRPLRAGARGGRRAEPGGLRDRGRSAAAVKAGSTECAVAKYVGYDEYREKGGYQIAAECLAGKRDVEDILNDNGSVALRGLGGAGFPTGRKWRILRASRVRA